MFTESAIIKQKSNSFGYTLPTSHEAGHLPTWTIPSNGSGVKINNPQTGVQYGVTTVDKLLSTLLSGIALWKNQPYIPTTQQPQQQVYQQQQLTPEQAAYYYAEQQRLSGAGKAVDGLEKFVSENSTILLIGAGALALFMSGRK